MRRSTRPSLPVWVRQRPPGFSPTTCGVSAARAAGDRPDSGPNGEATRHQPTYLYPAGKCHPEHNPENPQSALSGTPMWGGRSVRDRPGEAAQGCAGTLEEGPQAGVDSALAGRACSSWVPGSPSVDKLPRIAAGLRVASRSRAVLSRSHNRSRGRPAPPSRTQPKQRRRHPGSGSQAITTVRDAPP